MPPSPPAAPPPESLPRRATVYNYVQQPSHGASDMSLDLPVDSEKAACQFCHSQKYLPSTKAAHLISYKIDHFDAAMAIPSSRSTAQYHIVPEDRTSIENEERDDARLLIPDDSVRLESMTTGNPPGRGARMHCHFTLRPTQCARLAAIGLLITSLVFCSAVYGIRTDLITFLAIALAIQVGEFCWKIMPSIFSVEFDSLGSSYLLTKKIALPPPKHSKKKMWYYGYLLFFLADFIGLFICLIRAYRRFHPGHRWNESLDVFLSLIIPAWFAVYVLSSARVSTSCGPNCAIP
jgi:hypothetical protein